jgi:uncharacterized protein YkvS
MEKGIYVLLSNIKKVRIIPAENEIEIKYTKNVQHINLKYNQVFQAMHLSQNQQYNQKDNEPSDIILGIPKDTRLHVTNCGEIYIDDCSCKTLNIWSNGSYVEIKNVFTNRFHCIFQNSIVMTHGISTSFADIQIESKTQAIIEVLRTDTLLLVVKNKSTIMLSDMEVNDIYETIHSDSLRVIKKKKRKTLTLTDVFGQER